MRSIVLDKSKLLGFRICSDSGSTRRGSKLGVKRPMRLGGKVGAPKRHPGRLGGKVGAQKRHPGRLGGKVGIVKRTPDRFRPGA